MKTFNLIFFFVLSFISFSQTKLPEKIIIKYYEGGDYRTKKIRGVFNYKDSIIYYWKKEKYKSTKWNKFFKVYEYQDSFVKVDDLSYQKTKFYYRNIDKQIIKQLINYTDTTIYKIYLMKSRFSFLDKSLENDTLRIKYNAPKDLSYNYFELDSTQFKCNCEHYKQKWEQEKDCNALKDSIFLYELLTIGENRIRDVSSFISHLKVTIYYQNDTIILYQTSPCKQNFQWYLYHNYKEIIDVYNPAINNLIYKMLPINFRKRKCLLDYKDKEVIMRKYFKGN